MTLITALKLLIVASIVLSVFSLALRAHPGNVLHLFRHPRQGLAAFAAMYLVVPAIALAVVMAFELKPAVKVAILVLSLSPVPPLLPFKQLKSGADGAYISGLLVFAALVSLVAMPVGLHLFGTMFGLDVNVSTAGIAKTLALTIALPVVLGFIAQKLLGTHAPQVAGVVLKIAIVMLLAGALALLVMLAPSMWELVGGGTLVALVGMILAGLAAGYLLGGPTRQNRAALALASATRHPGVALGVALSIFPDEKLAVVAILMSVILNVIVGIPFLRLIARDGD